MREKIARALCEAQGLDWDAQSDFMTSASGGEDDQEGYYIQADAVLAALREPDEGMASAGMHKLSELPEDAGWETLARAACGIYTAMIDQAASSEGMVRMGEER